ncbi:MAG: LPXTG cell wall anchor domain-containing protein, partial [Ilumatobacteraceae bacterium]
PCPATGNNNVDCETTPISAMADLTIVKSASVSVTGPGGSFDWILDVANQGPGTAIAVEIGDIVPGRFTVTGVTSTDFACGAVGNTVRCTVASLPVGASGQVIVAVTVASDATAGVVANVGTVRSATADPDLSNNSDDASVEVVVQSPPSVAVPVGTLPKTGSDSAMGILRLASWLVLLGAGVLVAGRRRRNPSLHGR